MLSIWAGVKFCRLVLCKRQDLLVKILHLFGLCDVLLCLTDGLFLFRQVAVRRLTWTDTVISLTNKVRNKETNE